MHLGVADERRPKRELDMIWPFRRAPRPLAELDIPDTWSVSSDRDHGRPLLVRTRELSDEVIGHPDLPLRMGVAMPIGNPDDDGFAQEPERSLLDGIENALLERLERSGDTLAVAVISGLAMRELVFYCGDARSALERLGEVRARFLANPLQHYVASDPKWRAFRRLSR